MEIYAVNYPSRGYSHILSARRSPVTPNPLIQVKMQAKLR